MRYGMTRLANHQVAHGVAMYVDFAAEAVRVRGLEGPKCPFRSAHGSKTRRY